MPDTRAMIQKLTYNRNQRETYNAAISLALARADAQNFAELQQQRNAIEQELMELMTVLLSEHVPDSEQPCPPAA